MPDTPSTTFTPGTALACGRQVYWTVWPGVFVVTARHWHQRDDRLWVTYSIALVGSEYEQEAYSEHLTPVDEDTPHA